MSTAIFFYIYYYYYYGTYVAPYIQTIYLLAIILNSATLQLIFSWHVAKWNLKAMLHLEESLNQQGTETIGYGVGENERGPAVPPRPRSKERKVCKRGELGIELVALLRMPYTKGGSHTAAQVQTID